MGCRTISTNVDAIKSNTSQ